MRRLAFIAALLVVSVVPVSAQQGQQGQQGQQSQVPVLETRVFSLDYLRAADAAKLVAPFLSGEANGSGVYEAGATGRAITVRASAATLQRVESVLRAQDHAPPAVTLRFQLIAALDSAVSEPAIADVQNALRSLFRFNGYRLIASGSASLGDSQFELVMGDDERFSLTGSLRIQGRAPVSSVELNVRLAGNTPQMAGRSGGPGFGALLSTGLTLPTGETVVLGTAIASGARRALILTVRAEPNVMSLKK